MARTLTVATVGDTLGNSFLCCFYLFQGHMPSADTIVAKVSCSTCRANCCRLEVILMGDDDVPEEYTARDRWDGHVMARLDDGWCAALDRGTMLCRIYQRRPGVCREYEMGGDDCLLERAKTRRPAELERATGK